MIKILNLLCCTALLTSGTDAMAEEYEKNGMPCVAEVCIGDGLAELAKVPWKRSEDIPVFSKGPAYVINRKLDQYDLQTLRSAFRGNVEKAGPYLQANKFDALALPLLAQVRVACDGTRDNLVGTYTTASGNPTEVHISLVNIGSDTSTQRWTVTGIVRTFPKAVTEDQSKAVYADLVKRYAKYGAGNALFWTGLKPGDGQVGVLYNVGGIGVALNLSRWASNNAYDQLKQHPECGGTAKISVD